MLPGVFSSKRTMFRSALAGLWLVAALPFSMLVVFIVDLMTVTELAIDDPGSVLSLFTVFALAGGLWGRAIAKIAAYHRHWPFAIAGAASISTATIMSIMSLTYVERNLFTFLRIGQPVHVIFAVAFTLAALFLGTTAGVALGLSLGRGRLALQLGSQAGGASALVFILFDLGMDSLGFRVGAPRAEERATMLVVAILGLWMAALVASVVIGRILVQMRPRIENDWPVVVSAQA